MTKIYIIKGKTTDYEDEATWIHSLYFDQNMAQEKLRELHKFIKTLPNGGHRPSADSFFALRQWEEECKKRLKQEDPKSSFYGFGTSYGIEIMNVTE